MRSKPNRAVAPQRAQLPPPHKLPFRLGDLVLCRYSTYPYWPATIDQTHQAQRKGQHVCMHDTAGGASVLAFWCTFSNEDTGGWVRADRIVLFHPDLLHYVKVRRNHRWSDAQREAIAVALRAYHAMHSGSTVPPPSIPPPDLAKKTRLKSLDDLLSEDDDDDDPDDHARHRPSPDRSRRRAPHASKLDTAHHDDEDPMDIGSDSSEDHHIRHAPRRASTTSAPTARPAPKLARKKRKSTGSAKTPGRPPKRAKSAEHHLENQLLNHRPQSTSSAQRRARPVPPPSTPPKSDSVQVTALKHQIADMQRNLDKLTASLQRKEAALNQLREKGHTVSFAPVKTDTIALEQLPSPPDRDAPLLDSPEFESRVSAIRKRFEQLDAAAKHAHDKRRVLTEEQNKIRDQYAALLGEVSDAQAHVVRYQSELSDLLRGVYQSRVAVHDLRKHQAGNLVRTMSKMCKDMPNVSAYCAALYRSWKKQVVEYVHNAPSSGSKTSPSARAEADAEAEGAEAEGAAPASAAAETPSASDKPEGKENGDVADKDKPPSEQAPAASSAADDAGHVDKAHLQKSQSDAAKTDPAKPVAAEQHPGAKRAAPASDNAAASAAAAVKESKSDDPKVEPQQKHPDPMQVDTPAVPETKLEPAKKEDATQEPERMEVDDAKKQKAPAEGKPSDTAPATSGDQKPPQEAKVASAGAPEEAKSTGGAKEGDKAQDEGKTEPAVAPDLAVDAQEKRAETGGKTVLEPPRKPIGEAAKDLDDRKGLVAGTEAAASKVRGDGDEAKQKAGVEEPKGGGEKGQEDRDKGQKDGDEAMKGDSKP